MVNAGGYLEAYEEDDFREDEEDAFDVDVYDDFFDSNGGEGYGDDGHD